MVSHSKVSWNKQCKEMISLGNARESEVNNHRRRREWHGLPFQQCHPSWS